MTVNDPPTELTEFIPSLEARIFADMQSTPPQELLRNMDFLSEEDLICKQPFCLFPAGVRWQY